jgi:pilus assembly protein CpaD
VGGIDYNANTTSNYGCSVNANFAAMVAQPEDLVRGMPGTGVVDPATTYKAIDSYRRAKPTGEGQLKSESTKGS